MIKHRQRLIDSLIKEMRDKTISDYKIEERLNSIAILDDVIRLEAEIRKSM